MNGWRVASKEDPIIIMDNKVWIRIISTSGVELMVCVEFTVDFAELMVCDKKVKMISGLTIPLSSLK